MVSQDARHLLVASLVIRVTKLSDLAAEIGQNEGNSSGSVAAWPRVAVFSEAKHGAFDRPDSSRLKEAIGAQQQIRPGGL